MRVVKVSNKEINSFNPSRSPTSPTTPAGKKEIKKKRKKGLKKRLLYHAIIEAISAYAGETSLPPSSKLLRSFVLCKLFPSVGSLKPRRIRLFIRASPCCHDQPRSCHCPTHVAIVIARAIDTKQQEKEKKAKKNEQVTLQTEGARPPHSPFSRMFCFCFASFAFLDKSSVAVGYRSKSGSRTRDLGLVCGLTPAPGRVVKLPDSCYEMFASRRLTSS